MRATEDLLTEFFVNGHDGAVEQWEFGDYEGALEEIQSRGIDITKPDKRDAQEGRPGRIAIAPEGGGANRPCPWGQGGRHPPGLQMFRI